jgi:hypothetical protein
MCSSGVSPKGYPRIGCSKGCRSELHPSLRRSVVDLKHSIELAHSFRLKRCYSRVRDRNHCRRKVLFDLEQLTCLVRVKGQSVSLACMVHINEEGMLNGIRNRVCRLQVSDLYLDLVDLLSNPSRACLKDCQFSCCVGSGSVCINEYSEWIVGVGNQGGLVDPNIRHIVPHVKVSSQRTAGRVVCRRVQGCQNYRSCTWCYCDLVLLIRDSWIGRACRVAQCAIVHLELVVVARLFECKLELVLGKLLRCERVGRGQ